MNIGLGLVRVIQHQSGHLADIQFIHEVASLVGIGPPKPYLRVDFAHLRHHISQLMTWLVPISPEQKRYASVSALHLHLVKLLQSLNFHKCAFGFFPGGFGGGVDWNHFYIRGSLN